MPQTDETSGVTEADKDLWREIRRCISEKHSLCDEVRIHKLIAAFRTTLRTQLAERDAKLAKAREALEGVKAALDKAVKNSHPKFGEISLRATDWLALQDAIYQLTDERTSDD